ncbi:hypothetical protein EW146_g7406, partial [Bondarzewia mesenterica]
MISRILSRADVCSPASTLASDASLTIVVFRLRPNAAPQLAKLDKGPPAAALSSPAASGDRAIGCTLYDVVRRRLRNTLDMPSLEESAGDGVPDNSGPSRVPGESDSAVVGAALDMLTALPVGVLPKGGIRPDEKREDVERREAREPGRKGEGAPGT